MAPYTHSDPILTTLVRRGYLSADDMDLLGARGITTAASFLAAARDPYRRAAIADRLDLHEDDLSTAALVVRLLSVEGPGSIAFRDIVESSPVQRQSDLEEVLQRSDEEILEAIASADAPKTTGAWLRANYTALLPLLLGLAAVLIILPISEWHRWFMPTDENPIRLAYRDFVRAGIWNNLRFGLILMAGMGLAVLLDRLVQTLVVDRIETRIRERYLSVRDRLALKDALALLPKRRLAALLWASKYLGLVLAALAIAIFFLADRQDFATTGRIGALGGLLGGAILLVWYFVAQAQGFARLAKVAEWGRSTGVRAAEASALGVAWRLGATALLIYFGLHPAWTTPAVNGVLAWSEQADLQRGSAFAEQLAALTWTSAEDQAAWPAAHAEWLQLKEDQVDSSISAAATLGEGFMAFLAISRGILVGGTIAVLLAASLGEYLYASRTKGRLALAIWLAALLASEFLPDVVAGWLGMREETTLGLILLLALAAFIGVVSELGTTLSRPRTTCPNPQCAAHVDASARFCPDCGAPLRERVAQPSRLG